MPQNGQEPEAGLGVFYLSIDSIKKRLPLHFKIIILCANNFKNMCLGVSAGKLKFRTSSPAVFKSSYVLPFSRHEAYQMLFMGQGRYRYRIIYSIANA